MLVLRNDPAELRRAAEWIADVAREERFPPRLTDRLDLCLGEALANVVAHAFPDGGRHALVVCCASSAEWVTLEIEDDGRAFDPLAHPVPAPATRLGDAPIGQRGLLLIRHFAEESGYRREAGRNHLTLRWRRH
jgi:anti-sigma regulatory factor (Ser/Thr protein kinase)